jgi:hypothetical protein
LFLYHILHSRSFNNSSSTASNRHEEVSGRNEYKPTDHLSTNPDSHPGDKLSQISALVNQLLHEIKSNLSTKHSEFTTLELTTVYARYGSSISKITNFTDNLSALPGDLGESSKIPSAQRLLKGISEYSHFPAKVRCQSVQKGNR